ncbi:putative Fluoroacetate dehalogenase [Amylocarpus encephaloides]|uniref:Fluoroacetate dehalogenase n=1 Tax=Amylocarpus encephaloides TaxID=45428 RepID=A0A9P7YCR1_9HELO|nr:putative Fluoroacetate dehalogenase [Amylocarpus encephaloides]
MWDTTCITASSDDIKYMESLGLHSNVETTTANKVFYYQRGISNAKVGTPILVLIHGYPQTNFLWRHVVSLLPKDIPLFIPDLPGYGRSSPLSVPHSKRNVGKAILDSLHSLFGQPTDPQAIIIAGHDRGARVCHRLAVDADPRFDLKGSAFLDTVPGSVQWAKFQDPAAGVGFYHWAFLANVDLASSMIKAFGGDNYVRSSFDRWHGKNGVGTARLKENHALDVYAKSFKYDHVIQASCDDYRAGADEDLKYEAEDQRVGRKIDSDVLVLYSAGFLGNRGNIKEIWQEWMGKGKLDAQGFGDGVGHFIAEEAPEKTAEALHAFYKRSI